MPPAIRMWFSPASLIGKLLIGAVLDEPVALAQVIVHEGRAAAALDLAQHGEHVAVGLGRIVEQRVGALDAVAERDVDMGAGGERRQRAVAATSSISRIEGVTAVSRLT